MRTRIAGRWFRQLALDTVFFVWLLQFALTGRLLPAPIMNLIHPPPHIAAVTQPISAPFDHMENMPEGRPET